MNYDGVVFDGELELKDNRKKRAIKVDDKIVAVAIYNPNDPMAYRQMLKIQAIINDVQISKNYNESEEEQKIIESKLEDIEEIEKANTIIQKRNTLIQKTAQKIDDIYELVDSIFGDGICDILLKYSDEENNYLKTLTKVAFKEMNKARQVIKDPYKVNSQSDVIE